MYCCFEHDLYLSATIIVHFSIYLYIYLYCKIIFTITLLELLEFHLGLLDKNVTELPTLKKNLGVRFCRVCVTRRNRESWMHI